MDKFYQTIIQDIPSVDLKNCVRTTKFRFSDLALLKIILDYAPTLVEKQALLREASMQFTDRKVRGLAKKWARYQEKAYADFMQPGENFVYQIEIKTAPDAADEDTYITTAFDEAVTLIKGYLKYYQIGMKERAHARYTISKKTTTLPTRPSDYYNNRIGTVGKCVLDAKYRILALQSRQIKDPEYTFKCPSDLPCEQCRSCTGAAEIQFPCFLAPYDLVAFYDHWLYDPSHLKYGIICGDFDPIAPFVLLLEDNKYIRNRQADFRDENGYYRVYDDHAHPSYFTVIKPAPESVPQSILDDYAYAVDALRKLEDRSHAHADVIVRPI